MYRDDYLVCASQVDQGPDFRQAVYNAWEREMTVVDPNDADFMDYVPRIPDNNQFDVRVVLPGTKDQAERTIHFDDYKIWIKHPNDPLIKYKNIDSQARKCTILKKPESLSELGAIPGLDDINPKCCWSYKSK